MKYLVLASAVAALMSTGVSAGVDPRDAPSVPIELVQSVLKTPIPKALNSQQKADSPKSGSGPILNAEQSGKGRVTVYVKYGENVQLFVSKGHLNRIITPFEDAHVETTALANITQISSDDGILKVGTSSVTPVSMFVTEKTGDPRQSLSLSLMPQPMEPQEIELVLIDEDSTGPKTYGSHFKARQWEEGNPYIDTLKAITTDLAKGAVPSGYSLRQVRPEDLRFDCGANLEINVGQVFEGFNLTAYVAKATNLSNAVLEISEPRCYRKGIVAVAPWPDARLEAGASTEIFFIVHQPEPVDTHRVRPSLLAEVN